MDDAEIVNVYHAQSLMEAEFLHNILADAGVESRVIGDAVMLLAEVLPNIAQSPCLWVKQADEPRAREVLADYEQRRREPQVPKEPAATWKCTACGEMVDDDFDLCWNCQNPRNPY